MRTPTITHSSAPTKEKVLTMVDWLSDKKARDILALDLSRENSLSEAIIIATATSVRHGQGLADFVLQQAREQNYEFLRMEGHTGGK